MERQYIASERAHLMCPNMQFAVCATIGADYDARRLEEALLALARAHPFLRAVAAREPDTGRWYYDVREAAPLPYAVKNDASRLTEDFAAFAAQGWDATAEPLLRLAVYPEASGFRVTFAAHHLLCDGRGLLGLATEFADCYAGGKPPRGAEERLPRSLADLPQGSALPFMSRFVVGQANKNWAAENHAVAYADYLAFERAYAKAHPVAYATSVREPDDMAALADACRQSGVTVNDWLIAQTMLREGTDKVVIAADIRDKLACYRPGALGNYATALSVVSRRRTNDVMEKARDVARQTKARLNDNRALMLVLACYFAMTPELIDAVAIATLGDFPSKAGRFVGERMFGFGQGTGCGVTNLGRLESQTITDALFIPPASPANRLTVGALTVNGRLRLCEARAAR